jgi:3-isopropylmalate/(R)-2-methylmalate dehydratase small subunit
MTVWKYGDDINTDMLFPGKYTYTHGTLEEIKPHLLEDLDPDFATKVAAGDIIFAGTNFGCGSSREQPALGLRGVGVQAVIAKSFARIFFRAAINQGLLLIECPEAVNNYQAGSTVTLNIDAGEIKIDDAIYNFPTLPPAILAIRDAGGLMQFVREKLKQKKA